MKEEIEFSEFLEIEKKLEIIVGKIVEVEDVPKSSKLVKLTVDLGEETTRTVVTNIKPHYDNVKTSLLNKCFPFITNLKPAKMMGIESTAMIMPGDIENNNKLSNIDTPIGTKLL